MRTSELRSCDERRHYNRSSRYLRRFRFLYVLRQWDWLMNQHSRAIDRNEIVELMAYRMIEAGLYSVPSHFDPEKHTIPRNVLHGIGSQLHRVWKLKGGTATHPRWSWNTFCDEVKWISYTGQFYDPPIIDQPELQKIAA